MPDGAAITLLDAPGEAVRVEWDLEALARFAEPAGDAAPEPAWSLAADTPDWTRWEALRIVSVAFADGPMLAVAALRPAGADGHGDDLVGGVIVRAGAPAALEKVLLSTQFDAEGEITHVNVEAYEGPDSVALRAAGDRLATRAGEIGAAALQINVLAMRMDGQGGFGTVDVMRPA